MKYSIICSSRTGNTAQLADRIKNCLPMEMLASESEAEGDLVFVGFWTDKGSCDESTASLLRSLHNKKVFLFGTAGFGTSQEYFDKILERVSDNMDASNMVAGTYMCQGKMMAQVRSKYEAMMETDPERAAMLLSNFDKAVSHPDDEDLNKLECRVKEAISKIELSV